MRLGLLAALLAVLASTLPAASLHPDSFELRIVASVPYFAMNALVAGDADHDSQPELYLNQYSSGWPLYILEHTGGFVFDTLYSGIPAEARSPLLLSDADRDGRTDLVVQGPWDLYIYESADSLSLPLTEVWSHWFRANAHTMPTEVADLDMDGWNELYISVWNDSMEVYENTGDNQYAFRTRLWAEQSRCGHAEVVETPDMDRDGKPELFAGSLEDGRVFFFEAVQNDSFECVAVCTLENWYGQTYTVAAAPDMDRDGRSEAIVYGMGLPDSGTLAVIESPGDNEFDVVWESHLVGSYFGEWSLGVGDINGDSVPEIALENGRSMQLYRCVGSDQYEVMRETPCSRGLLAFCDIDGNGRDELVYTVGDSETVVLAYVEVGVAERELRRLEGVQVTPSVVRRGVAVKLVGLESRFSVQVLDAAGRVIAEPEDGVWRTDGVRPGAYFTRAVGPRVQGFRGAVTRKLLIVE